VGALYGAEGAAQTRSWLIRGWVAFALVTSVLPVLTAADSEDFVSDVVGGWLALYFLVSAFVAGILGAGALTQDVEAASDSILTRAVTRYDYVAARLGFRATLLLVVHACATLPMLFFARRFGLDDATTSGLIMAALITGVMLLFVTALGVAIGGILRQMMVAVVVLVVVFVLEGFLFDFINMEYLSSNAVLDDLPAIIRGDVGAWEQLRIVLAFSLAALAAAAVAAYGFAQRDF
jgi:hypothetical protein